MSTFAWPIDLGFRSVTLELERQTKGGVPTLDGGDPVVASPSIRWMASCALVVTSRDRGLLQYRQLKAKFDGRSNAVLFPAGDVNSPDRLAGIPSSIPFDDDTLFSDGTGWDSKAPQPTLNAVAGVSKTTLLIDLPAYVKLEEGQRFSTPDARLYEIKDIVQQINGTITVNVRPPLRATYAAGTVLEFEQPVCLMRLKTDQSGAIDLAFMRYGTPTLELVESKPELANQ